MQHTMYEWHNLLFEIQHWFNKLPRKTIRNMLKSINQNYKYDQSIKSSKKGRLIMFLQSCLRSVVKNNVHTLLKCLHKGIEKIRDLKSNVSQMHAKEWKGETMGYVKRESYNLIMQTFLVGFLEHHANASEERSKWMCECLDRATSCARATTIELRII